MATTNLNLGTIASSDSLSNFPTLFNTNMSILDYAWTSRAVSWANAGSVAVDGMYITTGDNIGFLIHKRYDANAAEQIFKPLSGRQFLFRTKLNGTWGVWHNPNGDLIWTNPSPTATFEAQTVSVTLSDYSLIRTEYSISTDYGRSVFCEHKVGAGIAFAYDDRNNGTMLSRTVDATTTGGVAFGIGSYSNGTTKTVDNSKLIPLRIYGIV